MIIIYDEFAETNKNDLFDQVDQVLTKRKSLWERYSRGISFESDGEVEGDGDNLQILFEKFIVDIATGYLSGEITYDVDVSSKVEQRIGKILFDKDPVDDKYADELRYILNTLAVQNDDTQEEIKLFRQALLYGSTYERVMEDTENKLKYINLDALNTVGVWDNSIDPKLKAVISVFQTKEGTVTKYWYRVYLPGKIEIYSRDNRQLASEEDGANEKNLKLENSKEHNWNKVPVNVYESDFSILDRCASIIKAYEDLINNVRNTYQYNDTDCKMKIVGYRAQNPIMIPNPDPKTKDKKPMILNQARIEEDNYVLAGKTFYVEAPGDADWLIKPVDAGQVTTMLKYYVDTIFQMCGIPNTADLAFNSADLNASAIDRKFYVMHITLSEIEDGIKSLIYNRFKMLLERINLKGGGNYAMDNVTITINSNLPSMTDETIERMMQLNGVLSQETIIEKLGYDWETEKQRKEDEVNAAMANVNNQTEEDDKNNDGEEKPGDSRDNDTDKDEPESDKEIQSDDKK